jgi:hypothetical protein
MVQKNTLGYFQESSLRAPEVERLNIFIGKWINEGYTIKTPEASQLKILSSDIYEWMPGGFFVLHTAYGRIGSMNVGGTEILGYDTTTKKYFSHFYDSGGNFHEAELEADGNSWTWKGKATGCTAVFTENGKVQTAHHVRLDEHGTWVPSMEVVLTKVH